MKMPSIKKKAERAKLSSGNKCRGVEHWNDITITEEFRRAFDAIEKSNDHVFLTGRAGTGKSTLLNYFRAKTGKKHVVLAPTGVAALNVRGQTIHSFFGFHPKIKKRLVRRCRPDQASFFRNLETVVIDEISMVRADLLDCVDRALRLNRGRPKEAFGGVQMVFIGDLFQLPPVVTPEDQALVAVDYASPYFFSSQAIVDTQVNVIELQKVHRQKDRSFVELLNRVRAGTVRGADVETWNRRYDPYFDPTEETDYVVHLTSTNHMAERRNRFELGKLEGKAWMLKADSMGNFSVRKMPSDATLTVKEGAHVMFTVNDPAKRWVNGTLGVIRRISKRAKDAQPTIEVELENGDEVEVGRHTWEVFEYRFDGKDYEEAVVGSYSQFPVILAWAVTIHKAQGKTFDRVLVDVGSGAFAHGQMYVALSRCTTLGGITLLRPFRARDVIVDTAVSDFMQNAGASFRGRPTLGF